MDRVSSKTGQYRVTEFKPQHSFRSVTEKDIIYFLVLLCENLIIYDRLSTAN